VHNEGRIQRTLDRVVRFGGPRVRSTASTRRRSHALLALGLIAAVFLISISGAAAAPYSHQGNAWDPESTCATGSPGCATLTITGFDPANPNADPNVGAGLGKGAGLDTFSYLVSVDNTRLARDAAHPERQNGIAPTESNSPNIAVGDNGHNTVGLPDGRYLISMRSLDHQMWGQHVTVSGGGWRRMARSSALGTRVRVIGTAGCGDCVKSKAWWRL
jgi:hypothetical protein